MRKLTIYAILWAVTHIAGAQEIVRVASYNIKFLNDEVSDDRKANLEAVLDALDADVIGLQEIEDRDALELFFPPNEWHIIIDDDSGDRQDLAIVAKKDFTIKGFNSSTYDADEEHFLFSDGSSTYFPGKRDLLCIEIGIPNSSESFYLMVAHTKARVGGRRNTDYRRAGAAKEMIKVFERDFDDKDFILLGDFNDSPDDAIMNILESGDPNMPTVMENDQGPFMLNLSEPLYALDHVTFGRNNSDRLPNDRNRINTTRPGIRQLNYDSRLTNDNIGDCMFDQILIPMHMKDKYMAGSFTVFDDASSVNGNNSTRASDHLPVYAEFMLGGEVDNTSSDGVTIVEALPNPEGDDTGNEYIILKNSSSAPVDLTGWSFRDKAGNTHPLDGTIDANSEKKIMLTGDKMPLNNTGDEIELLDDNGDLIDFASYRDSQVSSGVAIRF
ncbi:lamin tail domain-containing protein [Ekhidna sp.]|uniref:lamin tail domain-containing protein n=1 Tax=Ekhidna sp. TaxID=2608089 RepID=UPI0032EA9334